MARKRHKDRTCKGYTTDPSGESNEVFVHQTANTWSWSGKDHDPKALGDTHFANGLVMAQPKLDGMRATATIDEDGQVTLRYRAGLTIEWLDHIKKEVALVFKHLGEDAPLIVLDGELTIPAQDPVEKDSEEVDGDSVRASAIVSRQVLNSAIRSLGKRHPDNDRAVYNVFDVCHRGEPGMVLDDRLELAKRVFQEHASSGAQKFDGS